MTPELIHALAMITAAQARIAGMQAENSDRQSRGLSIAYGVDAFETEAHSLEQLAVHAINLPRGAA